MRTKIVISFTALACVFAASMIVASIAVSAAGPPPWAYGFPAAPGVDVPAAPASTPPASVPDTTVHHIEGSDRGFTRAQVGDNYGPADWFPGDHPAMPEIVSHGRKEAMIAACMLCHYPNGRGKPENAPVAGLSVSYFIQTMHDFRDGKRASADTRKANTGRMAGFVKVMTEEEIKASAEYFAAIPYGTWMTKVVETTTVPKTRLNFGMFVTLPGGEKEPIAGRLIETPIDPEATEVLRNPHSGMIVYTPPGSVKKGEALVKNGGGRTQACAQCHGADLRGLGPVPPIAGRSPSYMARQMYDMQQGTRKGEWSALMKPVVEKLTGDDFIAITAYLATLKP